MARAVGIEERLEIRTSRIPHAGDGVFTTVPIPARSYLGVYTGELISEEEYFAREQDGTAQYVMGLRDCAKRHTDGLWLLDGIRGSVFSRMNHAPEEFQNVRFSKICGPPFVKIVARRGIAAGEELWVDYGPRYRYDFMDDPAVIGFFDELRVGLPASSAGRRRARDGSATEGPRR